MLKIGLTGGIGCGKSVVSTFFAEWGSYIFDADKEAKKILTENETAQSEIIAEFGTDVLGVDNKIDKKKLSRIAFQDEYHQLRINTTIHPYIFREIDAQFDKINKKGKYNLFVLDAALIYESGADAHMDYVIVVTSRMGLRTERVMQRGGLTREEFLQRVDLQWPDEDKIHLADFVIQNNSTESSVKQEAKIIYDKLL
jgi:dephospho-CoA kinase